MLENSKLIDSSNINKWGEMMGISQGDPGTFCLPILLLGIFFTASNMYALSYFPCNYKRFTWTIFKITFDIYLSRTEKI